MDTSKMQLVCTDDFEEYAKAEGEEYILGEYNDAAECNGWEPTTSLSNEQLREYFDDQMNAEYDYFIDEYGDTDVLALASFGLWNGRFDGGKYDKLSSLMDQCIEDYNYVYYNKENGTFVLKAIHHDGTNWFVFHKLTEKGKEYLEESDNGRETHQHVINTEGMTTRFEL